MRKVLYAERDADLSDYIVEEQFEFDDHIVVVVNDEGRPGSRKFNVEMTPSEIYEIEDEFTAEPAVSLNYISADANDAVEMGEAKNFHDYDENSNDSTHIVLMDSGMDISHPLFDGMDVEQYTALEQGVPQQVPEDSVGHGTGCAGQIVRLNPDVKITSLRIFGDQGSTGMTTILRAYEWLNSHADEFDIVNMSWGTNQDVSTINRVHEKLIDSGVQDVVAAGNSGGKSGSPGTSDSAYSVGSCNINGAMSNFSSYNPEKDNPEVTALGENMVLARASGTTMGSAVDVDYVVASGTSFSAPFTAGLISLSDDPGSFAEKVVSSARDIDGTPRDGSGIVDYSDALTSEPEPSEPTQPTEPDEPEVVETADVTAWSFAGRDSLFINSDFLESGKYVAEKRSDGSILISRKSQ